MRSDSGRAHTYTHTYIHTHMHTFAGDEVILRQSAYIHTYVHTYIHTFAGDEVILRFLLRQSANIHTSTKLARNSLGREALHEAVARGHIRAALALVEHKMYTIDLRDSSGLTALHMACQQPEKVCVYACVCVCMYIYIYKVLYIIYMYMDIIYIYIYI